MTGHADSLAIRSLVSRLNLTAERERHLLQVHRSSSDEAVRRQALSELWESHSSLIVAIAGQYRRSDIAMTDLIRAGQLGMRAAIEMFDSGQSDARLSNDAVDRVRRAIEDYVRRHTAPPRPPVSDGHRQLLHSGSRLFADARRSCQREGVQPDDTELCARVGARLGLAGEEVALWLSLARGEAFGLGEPSAPAGPAIDEAVVLQLDQVKLRRRVLALAQEVLGERERTVFLARSVTPENGPRQRENLAAELGVTVERVYQLEVSARRKIATALAHDRLSDAQASDLPKARVCRRTPCRTVGASA